MQREIARLTALRDSETAVDRTYVINKLRYIVEHGEKESNRLRATELLGKTIRLFVDQVDVQYTVDTSQLQEFTLDELRALRASLQQPAVETEGRVVDSQAS